MTKTAINNNNTYLRRTMREHGLQHRITVSIYSLKPTLFHIFITNHPESTSSYTSTLRAWAIITRSSQPPLSPHQATRNTATMTQTRIGGDSTAQTTNPRAKPQTPVPGESGRDSEVVRHARSCGIVEMFNFRRMTVDSERQSRYLMLLT